MRGKHTHTHTRAGAAFIVLELQRQLLFSARLCRCTVENALCVCVCVWGREGGREIHISKPCLKLGQSYQPSPLSLSHSFQQVHPQYEKYCFFSSLVHQFLTTSRVHYRLQTLRQLYRRLYSLAASPHRLKPLFPSQDGHPKIAGVMGNPPHHMQTLTPQPTNTQHLYDKWPENSA